jgi:mono/diheme cytochrome c family protein
MIHLFSFAGMMLAGCGEQAPAPTADPDPTPKPPVEEATAAAAPAAPAAPRGGEQVYKEICQTCHQATGEGLAGVYPPLAGSQWPVKDAKTPIRIVLHGLQGEIEVKGQKYSNVMAPWGPALSDAEVANVLNHVRTSWGNEADELTADQVAEVRKADDGHAPWTVAELSE